MTRVTLTSGGQGGRVDSAQWRTRLDAMTTEPTDEDEARRMSQQVTCSLCQGQATATRGVVWINHAPRCLRRSRQDAAGRAVTLSGPGG